MGWTSVKNEMPNADYGMYQIYCKCFDQEWQMIAYYEDGEFFETTLDDTLEVKKEVLNNVVTHWMPLPEPPNINEMQSIDRKVHPCKHCGDIPKVYANFGGRWFAECEKFSCGFETEKQAIEAWNINHDPKRYNKA